ncbi:hypothetical protein HK405_015708 [Cladochytrium tenue]|nr:hypothetical protein HK405_015708 [Cladochytrium tenue]
MATTTTTTTAVTPKPRNGDDHENNDHPDEIGVDLVEALLLQHRSGGHWSFCKGHAESEDEGDRRLTVVRELREEIGLDSGLSLDELAACRVVSNAYTFDHVRKGYTVHKTNFFNVIWVSDSVRDAPLTLQEIEVQDAGWFEYHDAINRITFDGDRVLLKSAVGGFEA